jgi:tRNA dimethylallyltransferase
LSGGSDVRDVAIICGPTAAGKSAIAMLLAARTGALLISADSRQVYRRFDIGTAKPSVADRSAVEHLGIDVIEPVQRYSAAHWADSAAAWLQEAAACDRPAIVVGGTGFYLRALETPLFEAPHVDPVRRQSVLAELDAQATETLRAQCAVVDPARAHLGRTQLVRALETFALTQRPLSEWLAERARRSEFRAHYLLVDPGVMLQSRIAERVHQMLAAGWEAEVAALVRDVPPEAPAWNACGYASLRDVLAGDVSRDAAVERTIIDTRQYAKRQRTWFRHQLPAERVTLIDPAAAGALDRALDWLQAISLTEHT